MSLLLLSYIPASSSYHILADMLCSKSFLLRIIKVMTLHADGEERMLDCLFRLVLVVSCIRPLLNSAQLWASSNPLPPLASYWKTPSTVELMFFSRAGIWGKTAASHPLNFPSLLTPQQNVVGYLQPKPTVTQ